MEEEIVGTLEEVFVSDEEEVNDLTPTDIIEEPDDDPSIPTEDQDRGEAVDPTAAEIVINGEVVEPDEEDVINDDTVEDLTEPEIVVDEEPVEPIVSNTETLPTIGNVKAEDRVMIALVNGEATVLGTVGSGDRQEQDIVRIEADVADLGEVVADKASIADLSAATARITSLEATKADVSDLNAATGRITTLETDKANVSDLNAATGRITTLETDNTNVKGRLTAAEGNITTLNTNKANVSDLTAATGRITNLETNALTATSAVITDLQTNKVSTSDLQANYITANQIAANYAKVDASNMNTATIRDAWITALMVQSGLLAHSGTIYTLDAIQLNADRITAGTIDVQRLIVTVSGHKYLVQFDAQGNPTYVKLDGDAIQDSTITADKIVANTITTNQITTNNLVGTGGWINLHNGTFQYTNATSGEGISWDGTHLNINANSIYVGTTNVVTAIAAADEIATLVREYSNGVLVCKTNQTVGALVNADGTFDVVNVTWSNGEPTATDSRASLGETIRLGKDYVVGATDNESHVELDFHSLKLFDKEGNAYFAVDDMRDRGGYTELTEYATGDGTNNFIIMSFTIVRVTALEVDGAPVTAYHISPTDAREIVFDNAPPAAGSSIKVVYITSSASAKSYTFGYRDTTKQVGGMSVAEGYMTAAQGQYSHAEGVLTNAKGNFSHAEGMQTTASGGASHAEGMNTIASGEGSHASGYHTTAAYVNQTAIGRYNLNKAANLFEIGNGTPLLMSNAFEVDANGNTTIFGDAISRGILTVGNPSAGKTNIGTWGVGGMYIDIYNDSNNPVWRFYMSNSGSLARQEYTNGAWGTARYYRSDLMPGESLNMNGFISTGFLTNAKKTCYLVVPFPRTLSSAITSATISGTITVRQNNLYLFGSTSSTPRNLSALTLSVTPHANGFISISMTGSEQTNAVNNQPTAVHFNTLTITFR